MAICILKPKIEVPQLPAVVRPGTVCFDPWIQLRDFYFKGAYGQNHNNEETFGKYDYGL